VQYSPSSPPPPWPGPLPYPLLIADSGNDRMLEVTPDGRIVWEYPGPAGDPAGRAYGVPGDDAFFTPDGRQIVTNDEDAGTILRVDYYGRVVVWHFGVKGHLGSRAGLLNYPDDAYVLPDGDTIVADLRNCRELTIDPTGKVVRVWGRPQTGYCHTDLARGFYGYPNGDTPLPNGDILMSFISGDWIALLSPSGKVLWQVQAPDLYGGYVSDAQLLPNGDVLVCGYGKPGVVVIFQPHTGRVVWEYRVTEGPGELDHPSLALPLPNGNIVLNDDRNHRVVVIDPHTNQIVWQYGHTGVSGKQPGYLNVPDGIDIDYWRDWRAWAGGRGRVT
jgi:outer membrane protein assembly factor BamB